MLGHLVNGISEFPCATRFSRRVVYDNFLHNAVILFIAQSTCYKDDCELSWCSLSATGLARGNGCNVNM